MFWYPQIIYYCAPFTDCMSKITNTQNDSAKEIDVVMLVYDLIECNDNCLRTSILANSVSFLLSSGSRFGKNVIFGVDMSSSVHIDNKKKDISILDKGLTQELDMTVLHWLLKKNVQSILMNNKMNFY